MKNPTGYLPSYLFHLFIIGLSCIILFPQKTYAQDACTAPTCSNLFVEVIRQQSDVNPGPTCSTSTPDCGDAFRQLTYKVFLKCQTSDTTPFYLNYSSLDIALKLRNNSSPQFSHINVADTDSCFVNGTGSNWYNYSNSNGDKVIFSPEEDKVAISFANYDTSSTNCGSNGSGSTTNRIHFTYTAPSNADGCSSAHCAYAELFTIVVDAYAAEQIGFVADSSHFIYVPRGSTPCNPVHSVTSGPRCGFINSTVSYPDTASTANNDIIADFSSIYGVGAAEAIPVVIKNNGGSSVTVNYVEFTISASLTSAEMTFSGATPYIYPGPSGTKLLHYIIPIPGGLTIGASSLDTVSTITLAQTGIANMAWSYSFSFQSTMATRPKTRISSSNGCTALKTSNTTKAESHTGNAVCSDPTVHFTIEGEAISCDSLKVRVGLVSTNPHLVNIKLSRMKVVLRFNWNSPDITMTGVDYGSWPTGICSTYGDYNWPPRSCYKIGPMDSTYGVFSYGYATYDSLAPAFSLSPSEHFDILFSIPTNGCINGVTIDSLSLTYVDSGYVACVPTIDDATGFPLCGLSVKGNVTDEYGNGVKDVKIYLDGADVTGMNVPNCSSLSCSSDCSLDSTLTDQTGKYGFCDYCTTCNKLKVVPYRNDNPLNGITTYDLVLISKHILGIEPLGSPYKMIAADADAGNSITTFDIVELRKLILGIYDSLPNNTSWRFVDKSHTFSNPSNPFADTIPEYINCIEPSSTNYDFYAIKVGDVNNTAVLSRPAVRPITSVSWSFTKARNNGYVTVPIVYSGNDPLEAIQMGLRFDPLKLKLIGQTKGDVESYNEQCFNLVHSEDGIIKTLWFNMSTPLKTLVPGTILFYLTFKVEDTQIEELPLWLDNHLLDCSAWSQDGAEFDIQSSTTSNVRQDLSYSNTLNAEIYPNPTNNSAYLVVSSIEEEKARFVLYDASGKRLVFKEIKIEPGKHEFNIPEISRITPGVYVWKVIMPHNTVEGHLIKQ